MKTIETNFSNDANIMWREKIPQKHKLLTFEDGSLSDIISWRKINNVSDIEALDGFVLGDAATAVYTSDGPGVSAVLLGPTVISSLGWHGQIDSKRPMLALQEKKYANKTFSLTAKKIAANIALLGCCSNHFVLSPDFTSRVFVLFVQWLCDFILCVMSVCHWWK